MLSRILGPPTAAPPVPVRRELYVRRFLSITSFLMKRLFAGIHMDSAELVTEARAPVVIYTNHPSFWDPLACALIVSRAFPNHHIYAPIEEAALERFWFFNGLGFFGLKVDSLTGLREFLQRGNAILNSVELPCLIVTAEGRFTEPTARPIKLKRGLAKLLTQDQNRDTIAVPLALDYRLGEDPKPKTFAAFGSPTLIKAGTKVEVSGLQSALSSKLEDAMERNLSNIQGGKTAPNLLEVAQ